MSTKSKKFPKPRPAPMSKSAARAEGAAKSDRLRKEALAEIQERLDGKSDQAEGGKGKKPTSRKTRKEPKAKRVSVLDAAAQVVAVSGKPMRAKEMIAEITNKGLWSSPNGKTPEATLYAAIIREIAAKGDKARFKKHDRGQFVSAHGKGA